MSSLVVLPRPRRRFHPVVGASLLAAATLVVLAAALLAGATAGVVSAAWLVMAACAGFAVSGST